MYPCAKPAALALGASAVFVAKSVFREMIL